jgi:hypothetical protein
MEAKAKHSVKTSPQPEILGPPRKKFIPSRGGKLKKTKQNKKNTPHITERKTTEKRGRRRGGQGRRKEREQMRKTVPQRLRNIPIYMRSKFA